MRPERKVTLDHLFQEDWWLQAASDGRIETAEVRWDALRVASLSFMSHARFGIRSLVMPPYTRTLGPVLRLPEAKPAKHALNLQRVARELRARLPQHDRFQHLLDPEDETPFPFALAGVSVGQTFTFRVNPGEDRDELLSRVESATRRLIKARSRTLSMVQHRDVGRFLRLAERDRPLATTYHDVGALNRLFEACFSRSRGTFLTAVDGEGRDAAGVFLVWDDRVAYYLVPFRDREASDGGTNAFLLWSAMNFALDHDRIFDFDSYGSVGTARFMASFGAPPVPRHILSYRSLRSRCIDLMKAAASRPGPGLLPQDLYSLPSMANARLSSRERAQETT